MDGNHASSPKDPGRPSDATGARRGRRRRWPWVLAAVVGFLVLLAALAPSILSLSPFRRLIFSRISRGINGRVEAESWSLGWFSGFGLRGLRVLDARGEPVIEVDSVNLPASIPSLLRRNKDIGEVQVLRPRVTLVVRPDGTFNLLSLLPARQEPARHPARAEAAPQPLSFDLAGKVVVREGEVRVLFADGEAVLPMSGLDMEVSVESLSEPLALSLSGLVGGEKATLLLGGTAKLLEEGRFRPQGLRADLKMSLAGLELASLSGLMSQFGAPMNLAGRLDGNLSVQVQGLNRMHAAGDVSVERLAVSGGPLGQAEKLRVERFVLDFDARRVEDRVEIAAFHLDSSVATAKASGWVGLPRPGRLPFGALDAEARIDLKEVASQLPDILRLREGLRLESGVITLSSEGVSEQGRAQSDLSIRIEDLAASLDGRRVALGTPVALTATLATDQRGPRLEAFELRSSFAHATGQGGPSRFHLELESDLSTAMKEAAKFVDLEGKAVAGRAALGLDVTSVSPREKRLAVSLNVTDLRLAGLAPSEMSFSRVRADLGGVAVLDKGGLRELKDIEAQVAMPAVRAEFSARGLRPGPEAMPVVDGGSLRAVADLEGLYDLARGLTSMPPALQVQGDLRLSCGLSTAADTLSARDLDMTISGLDLALEGRRISEERVRLTGQATVRPSQRMARFSDGVCEISSGRVSIVRVDVPDWRAAPVGVGLDVRGAFDLEALLGSLKDFAPLPEGVAVKGRAEVGLNAGAPAPGSYTANVRGRVEGLQVEAPGLPVVEEEVGLEAVATTLPGSGRLEIQVVKLTSDMLSLTAMGELSGAEWLELEGRAELDFDRLGPLVAAFTGQPIEMSGKSAKPFQVRTSLHAKDWREAVRRSQVQAEVGIGHVKYMGLELHSITAPLRIQDGHASVTVRARMGGGEVLLPADLDCAVEPPVLTMPAATPVLTRVPLTDALADQLLSRISPVFKGMVAVDGMVSFLCHGLRAPVQADLLGGVAAEGELGLEGVSFSSSNLAEPLLDLMGLGGLGLALPDQRIRLRLREGRIEQDPLRLAMGDYELAISGSMGLDGSLDMTVELPITEEMVGGEKAVYDLLKDEVIRVGLTGTAARPRLAREAVRTNLKRLVGAAARKLLEEKRGELLKRGLEEILKRR